MPHESRLDPAVISLVTCNVDLRTLAQSSGATA